jgi:hypothetical protein
MPVAATAVWRFDMSDTAAGRTRQRLHLLLATLSAGHRTIAGVGEQVGLAAFERNAKKSYREPASPLLCAN